MPEGKSLAEKKNPPRKKRGGIEFKLFDYSVLDPINAAEPGESSVPFLRLRRSFYQQGVKTRSAVEHPGIKMETTRYCAAPSRTTRCGHLHRPGAQGMDIPSEQANGGIKIRFT